MKKQLRYLMTLLLLMVASVGWAGSITFGNLSLTNGILYSDPFDGGDFTVKFEPTKTIANPNTGRYYTTGSGIRVYGSEAGAMIFTAKSGNITKIEIISATTSGNAITTSDNSVSTGSLAVSSNKATWTGKASSVQITKNNSTGHWRVQTVNVTVEEGGSGSTVSTPTFSPVAGTYSEAQNVTISTTTDGSTIYYTTDGSTPDTGADVYSSAIPVTTSTTIKAIAVKDGYTNSDVATAEYVITYKAATPTFSPAAGTYTSAQNVTISTTTEGATIYYTTDGSDPDTGSDAYGGAIPVSTTTTIKAIAVKDGYTDSDIATAAYTINQINVNPKNVGSNYFVKVTDVADLEDGDAILIVNEANSKAMGAQSGNNCPAKAVTIANTAIDNPTDVQKLVLSKAGDNWMFCIGTSADDGFLTAASSSSNYLKTTTTPNANAIATIAISGGNATIKFTGDYARNWIRFNTNGSNPIFSCYASGQSDVQIYKEVVKPSTTKSPAEFAFAGELYYVAKDVESFTAPTLSTANGYDGTPVYSSSNDAVATVDSSTGVVTIVGAGEVTITAEGAETDNFYEDNASYTLNVYEIEDGVFEFAKGNYLSGVMPSSDNTTTLVSTWKAINVTMETAGRCVWWQGNKTFRLYAASGTNAAGSLTISVPDGYIMTRIDVTGGTNLEATVDAADGSGEKSGTTWTGAAKKVTFTHAGTATITLTKITVYYYPADGIPVSIGATEYATLYYKNINLTVPAGVTATAYKVDGSSLVAVKTYNAGDVIPAGTGVVLNGENDDYVFAISTSAGAAADGNMLRGSDEDKLTIGGAKYYMLSLAAGGGNETVGFYYGAEDGAAFTNKAHKAYLAVPEGTSAKATGYPFNDTDGINSIEREALGVDGVWYTIDGKRLNGEPTVKGIYVVNGKKVVIK